MRKVAAIIAGCATLLAGPGTAAAQRAEPGLVLSPSRVETEASAGLRLGPFGLTNTTQDRYRVRVFPVMLSQDRAGGITIAEDAASLRTARRLIAADPGGFGLAPGESANATATVRKLPSEHSLFAGLLFSAQAKGTREEQQITPILRLNASLLLSPPAAERRVAVRADKIRAEQAAGRDIRLLVAARNAGNDYLEAGGEWRVSERGGHTVASGELSRQRILPGATVELAGLVREGLDPGDYELEATVTMAGERARARGEMTIGPDGKVAFNDAAIADLAPSNAYRDQPLDLEASFENTGNVRFAPRAEVVARPVEGGAVGEVAGRYALDAEAAKPGAEGEIAGSLELPDGAESYELELRLLDGDRELDSRTVGVTISERPPLGERIETWISDHAIAVVAILLALVVALSVVVVLVLTRRRRPSEISHSDGRSGAGSNNGDSARRVSKRG